MSEWISVEDRLPESNGWYIVVARSWDGPSVHFAGWSKIQGVWRHPRGERMHGITHWMPLPEPPGESDE